MGAADSFRRFNRRLIRGITAVLLTIGLFLTYWLGVSSTWLLALVLRPARLRRPSRRRSTYWTEPDGYVQTPDDVTRQS